MSKQYNIVRKGDDVVERITTVNVSKSTVTKVHVTQHGKGDKATYHKMKWTFDFSDLTNEQLLEVASRDAVIKARPAFRDIPDKKIPEWDDKVFNVGEMLTRERQKLPPLEKAKQAVSNLSEDEREALLEELQDEREALLKELQD